MSAAAAQWFAALAVRDGSAALARPAGTAPVARDHWHVLGSTLVLLELGLELLVMVATGIAIAFVYRPTPEAGEPTLLDRLGRRLPPRSLHADDG